MEHLLLLHMRRYFRRFDLEKEMFNENKRECAEVLTSNEKQDGFSLVELLIVVVILGVFAAVAIPSLTSANNDLQRQTVARQLKSFMERARADSVKRNAFSADELAKVVIDSSTSYSLALDTNYNGKIESNEISKVPFTTGNGIKIVGRNLIFPVTITFNNRGQAKAVDGTNKPISPVFTVCENNCTAATADSTNSETLSISPTGSVAFVQKNEVYLDPVVPDVSVINTKLKVDPMAQVNN